VVPPDSVVAQRVAGDELRVGNVLRPQSGGIGMACITLATTFRDGLGEETAMIAQGREVRLGIAPHDALPAQREQLLLQLLVKLV
jgi:hypothetical protein